MTARETVFSDCVSSKDAVGVTEATGVGCTDSLSSCSHGHHSSDTDRAVSITTPGVFTVTGFQASDFLELCVLETVSS